MIAGGAKKYKYNGYKTIRKRKDFILTFKNFSKVHIFSVIIHDSYLNNLKSINTGIMKKKACL